MKFLLVMISSALFVSQFTWAGTYTLKVTDAGFEPDTIQVSKNEDVTLKVLRTTNTTCAKKIAVPSKKIKADLPLNKEVTLALGKLSQGELKFTCGLGMFRGQVVAK